MTYIVKCDGKKHIQLPDGIGCSVGAALKCPENCPKRSGCKMVQKTAFNVESVVVDDGSVSANGGFARYSRKEIKANWGGKSTTQTYIDLGDSFDVPSMAGEGCTVNVVDNPPLKPARTDYDRIVVRRRVYTNDDDLRRNIATSRPLAGAMRAIFVNWDTDAVFASPYNSDELSDVFVWLMVKNSETANNFEDKRSKRVIYTDEVEMILKNPNYSRSQKFFHLFYDVIYKSDRPDGFYWCDDGAAINPLVPVFRSKGDFKNYLLGDNVAGLGFYNERKNEVLSYLEIDDENRMFAEMTRDFGREGKDIVWIDRKHSNRIKKLGSKEEFVKNMTTPSELSNMKDMIGFLKEFTLNRHGISERAEDLPFEEIKLDNVDQGVFDAAQVSRDGDGKASLEAYLSLLREYSKSFDMESVSVGSLRFTRDNFGKEICNLIDDYCKEILSYDNGTVTLESKRKKSKVLLALILKEKNILKFFNIDDYDLLDRKIDMFKALSSGSIRNMGDYIGSIGGKNIYERCEAIKRDEFIKEWFDYAVRKDAVNVDDILRRYSIMYNNFSN